MPKTVGMRIPFHTGDRMSVLNIWYLHILGFRYRKCTLTIPTISRNGTVGPGLTVPIICQGIPGRQAGAYSERPFFFIAETVVCTFYTGARSFG